jgi:hypothetical protein
MNVRTAVTFALVLGPLSAVSIASALEKFQRLTGAQIQAKFAGMEMSDDVHWRDSFERDGSIQSQSMGNKMTGRWWVEKDQLCIDRGKDSGGCYQVWLAGQKVEFRREGLDTPILDGTLQRPTRR